MKKILLPCDFSAPSREAFRFAVKLAERARGEVFVLKVTPLPVMYEPGFGIPEYGFDAGLLNELEEDAAHKFDEMKDQLSIRSENIRLLNETGPVIPTIRELTGTLGIDAVVMGTHGEDHWIDSMLGTHTEKIMRSSPVPVFAIHKFVSPESIRNIVFPTNLPLDQPQAMARVKEMQEFFEATLHIVFVNNPGDFHRDSEIRPRVEKFVRLYGFRNYTFTMYNDLKEQEGIVHFTREINGDLIAMATHHRRGFAQLFSLSLTEQVLDEISWPLWSCNLE